MAEKKAVEKKAPVFKIELTLRATRDLSIVGLKSRELLRPINWRAEFIAGGVDVKIVAVKGERVG